MPEQLSSENHMAFVVTKLRALPRDGFGHLQTAVSCPTAGILQGWKSWSLVVFTHPIHTLGFILHIC